MRCRRRRFTRLRTTAPPTALLTTKPARAGEGTSPASCGSGRRNRWTTSSGRPALRPRRTAVAKSSRRLSRCSVGSTSWTCGQAAQADSLERPLLRRFATIARPARVRMRSRKPWVFARRRLFGWKVRLLTRGLQKSLSLRRDGMWRASTGCHRAPTRSSQRPSVHRFNLPIGGRRQQPSTTRPRYGTRGRTIRSNRALEPPSGPVVHSLWTTTCTVHPGLFTVAQLPFLPERPENHTFAGLVAFPEPSEFPE